jgi:putative transposase
MFKPRLHRLQWIYRDCPVYFVTACTAERRVLLTDKGIHEAFLAFAREAAGRRIRVGRYVLMPDHIHLFVAFARHSSTLSAWIKALKGTISQELRSQGLPGPFWQRGFFDHVMRSAESYEEKWTYVRENPVRAGLVKQSADWPFQGEIHRLSIPDP